MPGKKTRLEVQSVSYKPIGIIHSPFKKIKGVPIQSASARNVEGSIEVFPPFVRGTRGLTGFSHLILVYDFHKAQEPKSLLVRPYLDSSKEYEVFSTRSPARPNSIGISIVRQLGMSRRRIRVRDLDIIDGTPFLDIKPYVPQFDSRKTRRIGWYSGNLRKLSRTFADNRFSK